MIIKVPMHELNSYTKHKEIILVHILPILRFHFEFHGIHRVFKIVGRVTTISVDVLICNNCETLFPQIEDICLLLTKGVFIHEI